MPVPIIVASALNDQHAGVETTLTFNMPSQKEGAFYLAIGFKDDDPDWTDKPTNWIDVLTVTNNQERLRAWQWIGGASEPATYVLTQDSEIGVAVVLEISGVDLVNPINVTATTSTGSSQDALAPSITPDVAETLILRCAAVDTDDITATPATEIFKGGDGGSGDVGFGASFEDGPAADVASGTAAFINVTDTWASGTIAIAPSILKTIESFANLADGDLGKQNSYAGPYVV